MAKARTRRRTTIGRRPARAAAAAPTFDPDYTYIKRDLRRIAILATSYVVILVALSFVIK